MKKELKFKTVKVGGNWSYEDELDGQPLQDKEEVYVEWPDGKVEKFKVVLAKSSTTICDMGHDYNAPVREAYVFVPYHGAQCRVRLLGFKVARAE